MNQATRTVFKACFGPVPTCALLWLPLALLLPACNGAPGAGVEATPVVAVPVAPADPVAAFAARATPGAVERVILPETGQATSLRLLRAYSAASGRECREVQVGAGGNFGVTRLLCHNGAQWVDARPLLRGGAARP